MAGTVTVIPVAVAPADTVAVAPPMVTVEFSKLVPFIRTVRPRFCVVAPSEETVGASGITVKPVVTVPPKVVTLIDELPPGTASGTVTTNWLAVAPAFTVAVNPPIFTEIAEGDGLAVGFSSRDPLIVISVPTTAELLLKLVTAGAPTTVNGALAVPPSALTETVLSPIALLIAAPAGTRIRAEVAVATNDGAGDAVTPPIWNVALSKLVPVTEITVPAFPTLGEIVVNVGGW